MDSAGTLDHLGPAERGGEVEAEAASFEASLQGTSKKHERAFLKQSHVGGR